MSDTNNTFPTALQQISADVQSVKSALNSNRLFDVLDFVREEVARLNRQNAEVLDAVNTLHKEFLAAQANSTGAAD